MTIDWESSDFAFLRQQFQTGNVVLFAGAGFSVEAVNVLGESPPLGTELARRLAERAKLPYSNEQLSIVFETVRSAIGSKSLSWQLRDLFTIESYAPWYKSLRQLVWNRIYTINIDDLFQKLYAGPAEQVLETIVCPAAPEERDQLFGALQCVHLHGHVQRFSQGFTFTLDEFARQTATVNPWYSTLLDDLFRHPVVFVGTDLQEAPFYHYLQLRDSKTNGIHEYRPKSFLVSPTIGQIRARSLQAYNI